MTPRRGATALSGVLPLDKPPGMTSHDVVGAIRRASGERRVGHAGTLDPAATGLLVVLIGPATRLERYLSGQAKRYEATIRFGAQTDTDDADGEVIQSAPTPPETYRRDHATTVLTAFLGPQEQQPPAYSAIKVAGRVAHRIARGGETPDLAPRPIVVYAAQLLDLDPQANTWTIDFSVSKGTYIRALARDIGLAAGTRAHLTALRRTASGTLAVEQAISLETAIGAAETGTLRTHFIDPVPLLGFPSLCVDPGMVKDGRPLPAPAPGGDEGEPFALVDDGSLLAVYRRRGEMLQAETVFGGGIER